METGMAMAISQAEGEGVLSWKEQAHSHKLKLLLTQTPKINTSLCVHNQLFQNTLSVTAYLGKWLSHCFFSNLPKETSPDKEQLMK